MMYSNGTFKLVDCKNKGALLFYVQLVDDKARCCPLKLVDLLSTSLYTCKVRSLINLIIK